jgi:hypothetical protein
MLNKYINNNNRSKQILNKKQNIIDEYKLKQKNMTQRSKEWYNMRKTTIGGSEISTILGLNPFNNKKKLIADKIGLSKFEGNDATRWGLLFEDITKQWTEKCLLMPNRIVEIGNVEGINKRQRYSPDGVGVVKLNTEIEIDNELIENEEFFIVLFEFKSPFKSIPDNKIPKYYLPQVLTGLLNINITEIGIFVNNSYRKCSINNINNDNYNKIFYNNKYYYDNTYHGDNEKKIKQFNKVLGYGIIYIYQEKSDLEFSDDSNTQNNEQNMNNINGQIINNINNINNMNNINSQNINNDQNNDQNIYNINKILLNSFSIDYDDKNLIEKVNNLDELNNLIDFGNASFYLMRDLLQLYEKKRIKVKYLPLSIINENIISEIDFIEMHNKKAEHKIYTIDNYKNLILNLIKKNINKEYPIGYLPFKVLKSDILLIEKDENWINKITNPVNETLDLLDTILNDSNPIKKYKEIFNIIDENTENYNDEKISEEEKKSLNEDVDLMLKLINSSHE